jgi:hypothetical protein
MPTYQVREFQFSDSGEWLELSLLSLWGYSPTPTYIQDLLSHWVKSKLHNQVLIPSVLLGPFPFSLQARQEPQCAKRECLCRQDLKWEGEGHRIGEAEPGCMQPWVKEKVT